MKIQATIDIERTDCDGNVIDCFTADVEGDYTPACRGYRDHYGVQMEPDTEADIDYVIVTDATGEELNLCQDDMQRALDALWETVNNHENSYDHD